jgi:hypothetical protein
VTVQPTEAEVPRLCDFLERHQDDILAQWERALRRVYPETEPLPQAAIRDHIPDLLRSIPEVVRMVH